MRYHPIADLADYLTGEWALRRVVSEAAGQELATFAGRAGVHPGEDGLLVYREQGTLRMLTPSGVHEGPAKRCLHYRLTGPGTAAVHFDHGGFFHLLDLRTGADEVVHPCGQDRYLGRFEVHDADRWHQSWSVTGPSKQHTIDTDLRRMDA